MTWLAFWLEAWAARCLLRLFRALGPVGASNLAGGVARAVGPWLPVTRVAEINLRLALPVLDAGARRRVICGAWESLGRTVGEFPHIAKLKQKHADWSGMGHRRSGDVAEAWQNGGGPAILFSGHIGNWEMLPAACAAYGMPFSSMFRAAANPAIDALVIRLRQEAIGAAVPMFSKGGTGARAALGHLKSGGALGLLMDQKMNDGIEATLFGRPAMTAPALAVLALRFQCPVIPGHVQRIGPARFRLVCEPPMALPDTGDRRQDIQIMTQAMNDILERWIVERPESWLWMHRRWPKAVYR